MGCYLFAKTGAAPLNFTRGNDPVFTQRSNDVCVETLERVDVEGQRDGSARELNGFGFQVEADEDGKVIGLSLTECFKDG